VLQLITTPWMSIGGVEV